MKKSACKTLAFLLMFLFSACFLSSSQSAAAFSMGIEQASQTHPEVTSATPALPSSNFGSVLVGSKSSTASLSFSITSGTTIGSVSVLTLGAPNLDFADAGGSTCVAQTYSSAATCVVNVAFTPDFTGLREGAVVLADGSGNALATLPIYGVGTGPQSAFVSVFEKITATNLTHATDVAIDGAGNVYIVDQGTANVYKISPASPTLRHVVGSGWVTPAGVAVDGAGNVYVSDTGLQGVFKVTPAGIQTQVPGTLSGPVGLAVDGAGNLYIADKSGSAIYKVTPSGSRTTVGSGISEPNFLTVDAVGNVYVGDFNVGNIDKITPSGTVTVITNKVIDPEGIAVDAAGNVYAATGEGASPGGTALPAQSIFQITPSGTITTLLNETTNNPYPTGIAIDGAGDIFIANSNFGLFLRSAQVLELVHTAPTVYFYNQTAAGATDTSEDPQQVIVQNIGTTTLDFSDVIFPADFPQDASGSSTDCTSSTTLATSATCTLTLDFKPTGQNAPNTSNNLNEPLSIVTNTLNVPGTTQSASVTGTETKIASSLSLASSNLNPSYGASVTFTATASGSGATPAGSVTFLVNGTATGSANLSAGKATWVTTSLLAGVDSVSATYSGSVTYAASSSGTLSETVLATPSNILTASSPTVVAGGYLSLTATLTAPGSVPTGSVNFMNGTTFLTSAGLVNGVASAPVSLPSPGSASLTAVYSGDAYNNPDTSNTLIENVVLFQAPAASAFGSLPVGTTSGPQAVPFTIGSEAAIASAKVLTQGATGLDFADAGSSTCTAQTYSTATSCVVNVSFTPAAPGLRSGAVVLLDSSGNALATAYISGTGASPLSVLQGSAPTTLVSGFSQPDQVAAGPSGTLYTADYAAGAVYKITGSTSASIGVAFSGPRGVALDGAGNLYVASYTGGKLQQVTPTGTVTTIGSGFHNPAAVAVDGAGNIFAADPTGADVVEITPAGTQTTVGTGLVSPSGVAIDAAGNIYIADSGKPAVYKLTSGSPQTSIGHSLLKPNSVSVDAAGNVYISDSGNGAIYQVAPSGLQTTLAGGLTNPSGVAVDSTGNIYISNSNVGGGSGAILKINRSATSLSFATTAVGATSTDSPKAVTLSNIGNTPLSFSATTYAADFPEDASGLASDCSPTRSVASAASCTLTIDFKPTGFTGAGSSKLLSESLSITSNSLNSAALTQSITASGTETKLTSAVALQSTSASPAWNTSVTFTATVSGSSVTPTGSVNFYSGATLLGASTLTGGVATFATSSLPPGSSAINAAYAGNTVYLSSQSANLTETVGKATTAATLKATPNPVNLGSPLTLTATLPAVPSAPLPTGTIKFFADYNSLGVIPIVNGVATVSDSALTAGSHSFIAEYSGDANYKSATYPTITATVDRLATTVTLTPSSNPGVFGSPLTLTATVATKLTGTPPTGTVNFYSGSTLIGSGTLASGQTTLITGALTGGAASLSAHYLGDANYLAENSTAYTQTTSKAAQAVTLTALPTSASLQAPITLTAKIATVASGVVATGTVKFYADNVALGTAPVAAGTATWSVSTLALGKHSFIAQYNGDTNYKGGDSPAATATVVKAATTVAGATSASTSPIGTSVSWTATIAETLTGIPPTGTVNFYSGSTLIGTATATSAGVATLAISTLPAGISTITAHYLGDAHYLPEISPGFTQIIAKAPSTVKVASSLNPSTAGASVTFTSTVNESLAGVVPTGTIKFYVSSVLVSTATISGGKATFTTSSLTSGTHSVFASYSGDANYAGSNSPTLTQTVH